MESNVSGENCQQPLDTRCFDWWKDQPILKSSDCQSNLLLISTLTRRRKFMQVRGERKKTFTKCNLNLSWEVPVWFNSDTERLRLWYL